MNLKDLHLKTQLRLGLGAILLLVVTLGAVAWFQGEHLWQTTQGLYDHPMKTRRAVGELKADVLTMHRAMKDLLLAGDETERQTCLQLIDVSEADAHRQLDIIYDRYLGPREDVEHIQRSLTEWKPLREETLLLVRAGRVTEAVGRGKAAGPARSQVDLILKEIDDVSRFALARGDRFYQDAQAEKNRLQLGLAILFAVILLLASMVGFFVLNAVKEPLEELVAATEQYRRGDMTARVRRVPGNEFGALAASFNDLAGTVETEMRRKEQANRIADVMARELDLRPFCQALLQALLEHTGSQVGAIYLLNESKTDFELFASIGLSAARAAFSATGREGEFGLAMATRQIQRITDIPPDTRLTLNAVAGDFAPREILTLPLLSETEVIGLISLASLRNYPPVALQLVNDVLGVMTARLNGVLAFRQIREFSKTLEFQNRELEAQKRELAVQTDELTEQNIELALQKRELDEANRLKSAFLSNMSHELRTPLNSVIALSGVLHRRLRGTVPSEEHGYLEIIERNGRQLLELINDILDLSRIEAGKEELSLSRFSVQDLAREVAATLEPQAREKDLALNNLVGADLPLLLSDFSKCRHILQNLVGNAVKFTESGRVEIAADPVDGGIQLRVTDTGIGIAPEHIPHIFDEFRQAEESTSRRFGGTGLGLAIARKYALLLRGHIAVESAPGRGSTFIVTLPLSLPLPAPDAPRAPLTPVGPGLSSRSGPAEISAKQPAGAMAPTAAERTPVILLVEDSEPAVIQITDILAEQGYELQVARDGRKALDHIAQMPPDALILDLMMPGVDGFQVLRSLRETERTAHLPVLILTAKHITLEELSVLRGNHIQQLIQKGDINKAELQAAVEKMVCGASIQSAPPRAESPADKTSTPPPLILVVEDNADNLKTVRALLQETATIYEAADGPACIAEARSRRPDLILLDIALPGMDGFKTLAAIRQEETLRRIPVVALTARAMKGDREQILGRGFDGYVSKPINEPALKATLRSLLHGR